MTGNFKRTHKNTTVKKVAKKLTFKIKLVRGVVWTILFILLLINALALLISGYSGYIAPELLPWMGVVSLAYGPLLWSFVIITIIALIIRHTRVLAVIFPITIAIGLGPFLNYFPVNLFHSSKVPEGQEAKTFKLMSYNVMNLESLQDKYPDDTNQTATFILKEDADIVLLEEFNASTLRTDDPLTKKVCFTKEQKDSLVKKYPYYYTIDANNVHISNGIFSKYPMENIPLTYPEGTSPTIMSLFRVFPTPQDTLTIYMVHLQSIGITAQTGVVYSDLRHHKDASKVDSLSRFFYHQIREKSQLRAVQARWICSVLDSIGGDRVIVAGDFNDNENCYTVNELCKRSNPRLHQTWRKVGFGPLFTYHANLLYFHIDHILYGGGLKPLWMRRVKVPYSDHYPIQAEFLITPVNEKD